MDWGVGLGSAARCAMGTKRWFPFLKIDKRALENGLLRSCIHSRRFTKDGLSAYHRSYTQEKYLKRRSLAATLHRSDLRPDRLKSFSIPTKFCLLEVDSWFHIITLVPWSRRVPMFTARQLFHGYLRWMSIAIERRKTSWPSDSGFGMAIRPAMRWSRVWRYVRALNASGAADTK